MLVTMSSILSLRFSNHKIEPMKASNRESKAQAKVLLQFKRAKQKLGSGRTL
jgi:hypothetical protein